MLYRSGIERGTQLLHQDVTLLPFGTLDTNLDQFMGLQRALEFGDDAGRETVICNGDDGTQVMRTGAKFAALGRR